MSYWNIDPWATIDEQIDRAQAAAGQAAQTVYGYTPMGMGQWAYENAPDTGTILETIDEYTYTPWELGNDAAELALEQAEKLNPLNAIPEINWGRVAVVVGVMALGGSALYLAMRR